MTGEGFLFTARSKRELIEHLIVAVERAAITIPANFEVYRRELESVEILPSEGGAKCGVPNGTNDAVISLALAVKGFGAAASAAPWLCEIVPTYPERRGIGDRTRGGVVRGVPEPERTADMSCWASWHRSLDPYY